MFLRLKPAGISPGVGIYRIHDGQFVVSADNSLVWAGPGGRPVDLLTSSNLAGEDDSPAGIDCQVAITFVKLTSVNLLNLEHFVSGGGDFGFVPTFTLLEG